MKTKNYLPLIAIIIAFGLISCSNEQTNKNVDKQEPQQTVKKEVITKKIMYDVTIVNEDIETEEDYKQDWFWMNIPEQDLDKLLLKLYDDVKNGFIPAYYFYPPDDYEEFEQIPKDKIQFLVDHKWYVIKNVIENGETLPENIPINKEQIIQLRFLEEWHWEGDEFCKKVIAVAPVFAAENPTDRNGISIWYWVNVKDLL